MIESSEIRGYLHVRCQGTRFGYAECRAPIDQLVDSMVRAVELDAEHQRIYHPTPAPTERPPRIVSDLEADLIHVGFYDDDLDAEDAARALTAMGYRKRRRWRQDPTDGRLGRYRR